MHTKKHVISGVKPDSIAMELELEPGFLPGWLIVDSKTKDMYKLDPEKIQIELVPLDHGLDQTGSLNRPKEIHQSIGRKHK